MPPGFGGGLADGVRARALDEPAARARERPGRGENTLLVAGADPEEPGAPEVDLEARVRELLAEGLGPKDLAARLRVATGLPRRHIYQLALALARETPSRN